MYNTYMNTTESNTMHILDQLAPGLTEQEVLDQAYAIMLREQGFKTARYYFGIDQDYASDLVTAYFYQEKDTA